MSLISETKRRGASGPCARAAAQVWSSAATRAPSENRDVVVSNMVAGAALGACCWLLSGLTSVPGLLQLAAVAFAGGFTARGLSQATRLARGDLTTAAVRSLSQLIGAAEAVELRGRRWTGPWPGRPARVTVLYDALAPSHKPGWEQEIVARLGQRLGSYELVSHDPRRRRLVLSAIPEKPTAKDAPDPELASRVDEVVSQLLGTEATATPTWRDRDVVAVDVQHRRGVVYASRPGARTIVERTFDTMLPGRWRAKWDLQRSRVHFELRPEFPSELTRPVAPIEAGDRRLPYALDEDGTVLAWDLRNSAAQPHMLITGSTGTGKTVTIRGVVLEACRRHLRVRICDPKRVEFVGLRGWPNIEVLATDVADMVAVIHDTHRLMEDRYRQIEQGTATDDTFEDVLLVLDEFRYFYGVVNAWYATVKPPRSPRVCPIIEEVFQIASLGRTARVHLLIGTQRPDAEWMGGDLRDQFNCRYSLGRLSPDGAKMMWQSYSTGTTVPRKRPGRGTAVGVDADPVEAQSYWTPDPRDGDAEYADLLKALKPGHVAYPQLVVVRPPLDDEAGEPIDPAGRYVEFRDAPLALAAHHPDLVLAPPTFTAAPASPSSDAADVTVDGQSPTEEGGAGDGYNEPELLDATALHHATGSLIQVDEALDIWAVIESADPTDDDQVAIGWRSDDDGDDFGLLVVDGDDAVLIRRPLDDDR